MTLQVFTSRPCGDPDALDITRGTADRMRNAGKPSPGEFLAPSAALVFPVLRLMKAAQTDVRRDAIWASYVQSFRLEMLASYEGRRAEWEALLARPRTILTCFCTDPNRCHRTLVAGYLARLGAVNCGEILGEKS